MTDLTGKVALITGGSKGIGRAIALAYGKLGINVALTYMGDKDSAHDAVLEIESYGGKALAIHADVRNEASIKAMAVTARDAFGQIDILVNNAGITMAKPWQQVTTDDWNTIVATNLTSAFLTTQESRQRGRLRSPDPRTRATFQHRTVHKRVHRARLRHRI